MARAHFSSANVRDQVSPLASGATPCASKDRDRSAAGMGINCIALFALLFFSTKESLQSVNLPANHVPRVGRCSNKIFSPDTLQRFRKSVEPMLAPNVSPNNGDMPVQIMHFGDVNSTDAWCIGWGQALRLTAPDGEKVDQITLSLCPLSTSRQPVICKPTRRRAEEAPARAINEDLGLSHIIFYMLWTGGLSFMAGVLLNKLVRRMRYISANVL